MACSGPKPRNVLLISMDTTRADHLGCYGHTGIRTPNIDQLAAESLRFEHCFSAVPVTLPSHTTIMSGRYPIYHSVRDNGTFKVPTELPTLASILSDQGWTTMGVIGSYPITKEFGLARGFQFWDEDFPPGPNTLLPLAFEQRTADKVTKTALGMLQTHGKEPFFLFVHYFDDHRPWQAPPLFARQYPGSPYDAEIAYLDSWIGELLSGLKRMKLDENTIVVLTGDHGEGLSDHEEETHSLLLYNGTLHVPLLLKAPGLSPGVVQTPVSSADIAPTILELLGLPAPEMNGISLLRPDENRLIYSESLVGRLSHGWNDLRSAVVGNRKFILGFEPELYDVGTDEGERNNLAEVEPEKALEIKTRLLNFIATHQGPHSLRESFGAADSEIIKKLRALGYVVSTDTNQNLSELGPITKEGDPRPKLQLVEVQSVVRSLVNEHRLPLAMEVLASARKQEPDDMELLRLEMLVRIFSNQGQEALEISRQIESRGTLQPTDLRACALAHRLAGDDSGAIELLSRRAGGERDIDTTLLKIDILDESGHSQEGDVLVDQLLAAHPCEERTLWTRARRLRRHKASPEQLTQAYEEVLKCSPGDERALYNLGNIRFETGDISTAQEFYQRALNSNPNYLPAHFGRGLVLRAQHQKEAAKKEFEWVLRQAPINTDYGRKAADLLEDLENKDE